MAPTLGYWDIRGVSIQLIFIFNSNFVINIEIEFCLSLKNIVH
jgi:hypothetical protein